LSGIVFRIFVKAHIRYWICRTYWHSHTVFDKDEIDEAVNKSHTHLEEISKGLAGTGFLVTHHVRVGDPTEMILSVGEEDYVSLIALSPHGKNWFEDSIIGSTAFTVANTAKEPVLIVRENKDELT